MKTQSCVTDQELIDFDLGNLSSGRHNEVSDHIDNCDSCASRFEGLAGQSDDLLQHLRGPLPEQILTDDSEVRRLKSHANALHETGVVSNASSDTSPTLGRASKASTDDVIEQLLSPPQHDDELGRLGNYRVLRVIGRGGMGLVFDAEDLQLKRRVAVKVMLPQSDVNQGSEERFLREAQSLAAIQHDHVVTIHHVGRENGVPVIAMQLLEGESLKDRLLREKRLAPDEVSRIAVEAAEGLRAAHQAGLIHRDIKPDNIWLEAGSGRVKLVDFGLARAEEDTSNLTLSGYLVGTPSYLPPEQGRGEDVDERSDLFSLGVVLYEMLTGTRPFDRRNVAATLRAIELEEPESPYQLNPETPEQLSGVVMKLLEKEPGRRFQTSEECILAVEECVRKPAGPGATPATMEERSKPGRYVRPAAATLAVLATFVLSVLVYINTGEGTVVVQAKEGFTVDTGNERVTIREASSGREFEVRINEKKKLPSGSYELQVADNTGLQFSTDRFRIYRDGDEVLSVWSSGASGEKEDASKHSGPPVATTQPLSPMALTATPAKIAGLHSWTMETRRHRSDVYLLATSSDGKFVASAASEGTLRIWRTEDFEPVQVLYFESRLQSPTAQFHGGAHYRQPLVWSRDGKYLACATSRMVSVFNTETWEEIYTHAATDGGDYWHLGWSRSGLLLIDEDSGHGHRVDIVDVDQGRVMRRRNPKTTAFCCWDESADRVLMTLDDTKIVAWDFRTNRDHDIGPFEFGRTYSPNLSRYFISDSENKQWLVKSRVDDAELCAIVQPEDLHNTNPIWSPDGRFLTWNDPARREQRIVAVETGEDAPGSPIIDAYTWITCWLPDSTRLMLRNSDEQRVGLEPTLRIVDLADGEVTRHRITYHSYREVSPAGMWRSDGPNLQWTPIWSPDGTRLLSQETRWYDGAFRRFRMWNLQTGQFENALPDGDLIQPFVQAWSENGTLLGIAGSHSSFQPIIFDLGTGRWSQGPDLGLPVRNTTRDGRLTVFRDPANQTNLRIVDLFEQGTNRQVTLRESPSPGWQPGGSGWGYISPDGTLLATIAKSDPELKIWSLNDGSVLHTIDAERLFGESEFSCWLDCSFSPNNQTAILRASLSREMVSLLWDLANDQLVKSLDLRSTIRSTNSTQATWISDKQFVHSTEREGLLVFDQHGNLLKAWNDHGFGSAKISVSPDGSRLACTAGTSTGAKDQPMIQIRDIASGQVLSTYMVLPTEYGPDLPLSFGPAGHWHAPDDLDPQRVLLYIARTEDGRRLLLTPDHFESRFKWKNDPSQVAQPVKPRQPRTQLDDYTN